MAGQDNLKTRIREVRKGQGLTLQELAQRIGTTPQSVQRLETGKTKLNLDWLDRFASALDVPMAELLAAARRTEIEMLGELEGNGILVAAEIPASTPFLVEIAARDPVCVRLRERVGLYPEGSVLIADRRAPGDHSGADGRSCLVALADGRVVLRRVVVRSGRRVTLVAHGGGEPVLHDVPVDWLAPVVMMITYL